VVEHASVNPYVEEEVGSGHYAAGIKGQRGDLSWSSESVGMKLGKLLLYQLSYARLMP
jgi:hypothetical protein